MIRPALIALFAVSILIGGSVLLASTPSASSIEIPKAVHFLTPNGDDVVVGPGMFEVEAMKDGLTIKPKGGRDNEAVVG